MDILFIIYTVVLLLIGIFSFLVIKYKPDEHDDNSLK